MPIMEISVVPIGTQGPSISDYVACSEKAIRDMKGVKSQITAMGTIVESDSLDTLLSVVKEAHNKALSCGAIRVITNISIDDRRDKKSSIEGRVEALRRKI